MKLIVAVALALVAVVAAFPVETEEKDEIISQVIEHKPDGGYSYRFLTKKGVEKSEDAQLVEILDEEGKPHKVLIVSGKYSYIKDDGTQEVISYSADGSGFHAEGPSIPRVVSRR